VRFTVGDDDVVCERGTLVVVKDPTVVRGAVAETADAVVLAVGNREADHFETTWQPEHFRGVSTYDDDNPR
jgi:hypothetical protein